MNATTNTRRGIWANATRTATRGIWWGVIRSMTPEERDDYQTTADSCMPITPETVLPVAQGWSLERAPAAKVDPYTWGTITLANGATRRARTHIGQFSGKRFFNYITPAGHLRMALPRDAATFTPDAPR